MSSKNGKPAEVIHVVRYDDFSAASESGVEEALFDLLWRHQIPCTVAVIPFVCDPRDLLNKGAIKLSPFPREKAKLLEPLLKARLAEVALHGYAHMALAPLRGYQEFSDAMPKETQRNLIRHGRQYLEDLLGVKIEVFVPPWNRLTASTAGILSEEGLMVSGDLHANNKQDFELAQVPCAASIEQTARALLAAQRFVGASCVVGTLIHDYDFIESGYNIGNLTISEFEPIASSWARMPNVQRLLITDAIRGNEEPVAERARANTYLIQRLRASRLGRRLLPSVNMVYWNTRHARRFALLARLLP